jgi:hypothetical protein
VGGCGLRGVPGEGRSAPKPKTAHWLVTEDRQTLPCTSHLFLFLLLLLPPPPPPPPHTHHRPYAEKYAADEAAFFSDYAVAHVKLSELGVAWEQGGPVTLD